MDSDTPTSTGETSIRLSVTEQGVAQLWREVLSTSEIPSATDNFFELGGDSMAMVLVEHRIQEEFSVEVPAGTLLGAPTLREFSVLVDAIVADSRAEGKPRR